MEGASAVIDYDASAIGSRVVREQAERVLDELSLRRTRGTVGVTRPDAVIGQRVLIVGDLHRLSGSQGLDHLAATPAWMSYVVLVRTESDRRLLRDPDVAMHLNDRLLLLDLTTLKWRDSSASSALRAYLRAVVEQLRPDRVRSARFAAVDDVLWLEFGDGLARALNWSALSFASRIGFAPVSAAARRHGQAVVLVAAAGQESTVDAAVLRGEVDAGFAAQVAERDHTEREVAGSRIRHIRESRGLSQQEVAERSGVPQESLSRIENGHRDPRLETLRKLAAAFGIDLPKLLAQMAEE